MESTFSANLFENFNSTNQTQPHFEAHESFVTDIKEPDCALVQTLPYDERCRYVEYNDTCLEFVNLFDYTYFFYCTIAPQTKIGELMGIGLLFACCLYMFVILGTSADRFFCPSLTVLSKFLGISENVAGVTLLAFGNGSPDLFVSFTTIAEENPMLYSELMGAAIFVCGFIAGIIIFINPFRVSADNYARDSLFMLFTILYIDYIAFPDGVVSLKTSVAILVMYILYIIVVIIDEILVNRQQAELRKRQVFKKTIAAFMEIQERKSMVPERNLQGPNKNIIPQFLNSVYPIDNEDWRNGNIFSKAFIIIRIPANFALQILLPITDFGLELNGWSKLLNCLQVIILPSSFIFYGLLDVTFYGVPLIVFVVGFCSVLSITFFCLSRTDQPPKFHMFFTILAALGSVFVIYVFASEIVNILTVFGIVAHLTPSFLGCSVLAWGNSIGDLVANIALTRQGYQQMGFSACFGGPLLNCLLGLGVSLSYKAFKSPSHTTKVTPGSLGQNCAIFLCFSVFLSFVALNLTNFHARRAVGLFMIFVYIIYLTYTLGGTFEIIHEYGTDHSNDHGAEF